MCNHHSGMRSAIECIVPPFMHERLAESPDADVRRNAINNLQEAARLRGQRATVSSALGTALLQNTSATVGKVAVRREIYDQGGIHPPHAGLPGKLVRSESSGASADVAVNEAFTHSGNTWKFYWNVFGRNSIDGNGMTLVSSVHAGNKYDNAFWNGVQMVYGDGSGTVFRRFTRSLDVVGHELTHGVVQFTSGLIYDGEPGALNEHFADAFGIMVRQYQKKESAAKSDWLIGKDLLVPALTRNALRSLKAPGTAFVGDPDLGDDPQPSHYTKRYKGSADNHGVHINSGIPNHAFYLAATAAGGRSWLTVGPIWYEVMQNLLPNSSFADFAKQLRTVSTVHAGGKYRKIVNNALKQVGL